MTSSQNHLPAGPYPYNLKASSQEIQKLIRRIKILEGEASPTEIDLSEAFHLEQVYEKAIYRLEALISAWECYKEARAREKEPLS